jgi:hypothetical protein
MHIKGGHSTDIAAVKRMRHYDKFVSTCPKPQTKWAHSLKDTVQFLL